MSILSNISAGGIQGIISGVGTMAKDIRAAITGKSVLTNDDVVKLEEIAHNIEIAALSADKEIALAQAEINKQDSMSENLFKSGWRPAVGWVCVIGLFYQLILRNILPWSVDLFGYQVQAMPSLELDTLMTLLFGLLGLGGFRTFEKVKRLK